MKFLSILGGIVCAAFVSTVCVVLFTAIQDNAPQQRPVVVQAAAGNPPRALAATYTPVPQQLASAELKDSPAAASAPTSTPAPASARQEDLTFADAAFRATESNDTFTRFSWQVTLTDQTSQPLEVNVTAKFLDADGFVLDEDTVYHALIEAGNTQTVTDYQLIKAAVAPQVDHMQIQAEPR